MGGDWEGGLTPEREQAYLERFLRPVQGPVLDLACGAGSRTRFVAAIAGAARVIALDYSLPMLEACGRALQGVTLVRGSASALPFADASLGGINCSDALQALPDPAQAFAEAGRCLRPGAPFTGFTFRESAGVYAWFQHRFPAAPRQLFTDAGLSAMADRAGFEMVDIGGPAQAIFFTAHRRK
jgi:ubiquinone/menaquinone biosynthesis C-methylase UbiE